MCWKCICVFRFTRHKASMIFSFTKDTNFTTIFLLHDYTFLCLFSSYFNLIYYFILICGSQRDSLLMYLYMNLDYCEWTILATRMVFSLRQIYTELLEEVLRSVLSQHLLYPGPVCVAEAAAHKTRFCHLVSAPGWGTCTSHAEGGMWLLPLLLPGLWLFEQKCEFPLCSGPGAHEFQAGTETRGWLASLGLFEGQQLTSPAALP